MLTQLKANEPVKVFYEMGGESTYIEKGLFIAMDENGVLLKDKVTPVFSFIPRERVVMIEQVDQTGPLPEEERARRAELAARTDF